MVTKKAKAVGPVKAAKKVVAKPAKAVAKKVASKRTSKPVVAPKPDALQQPQGDGDGRAAARGSLTPKQEAFVREFLVDMNATGAATRAGFSAASAETLGWRMLRNVEVAAAIAAAQHERARRTEVKAEEVVARFRDVAFADPRELCGLHRNCCRYCWGKGHRFQRTATEMERARAEHEAAQRADHGIGAFDVQGGEGYNANREINPDCPECFGDGIETAYIADTRNLSPSAASLFAGIKVTKVGIEVLMHDQLNAAIQLARHLGLFNDKLKLDGKVVHDATAELREFLMNSGSRLPMKAT